MGFETHVFTSSHKKDDLLKKLGASKIFLWTKDEHIKEKNEYKAIINSLPCKVT